MDRRDLERRIANSLRFWVSIDSSLTLPCHHLSLSSADLGPSPATLQNYDPAPYGHQLPESSSTQPTNQDQYPQSQPPVPLAEDEAYYFDESTGAVYDSQGRLVRGYQISPSGQTLEMENNQSSVPTERLQSFRPMAGSSLKQSESEWSSIPRRSITTAPATGLSSSTDRLTEVRNGLPLPSVNDIETPIRGSIDSTLPLGSRRGAYLADPKVSLDRKSSNASSIFKDNASLTGPTLNHSRSIGNGFSSMDVLNEVDRLPSSNSGQQQINNNRNIGTTAGGGIMVDNNIPSHVVPPNSADGSTGVKGRRGSTPKTPNSLHNRRGSNNGKTNDKNSNSILPFAISLPKQPTEIRRRSNGGDFGDVRTPSYEEELSDELRKSNSDEYMDGKGSQSFQLGNGDGLVHPSMQGVEVGSRGMRMVELEMEIEEDSPYPEVSSLK